MASVGPLNLKDITRSALERIILQLLNAEESEEKKILDQLKQDAEKESNDLADLKEEKKGKAKPVSMDDEPKRKGRE